MANPSGASSSSSSTVQVCFSDCDDGTRHDVNITSDMVVRDLKMLCAALKSPPCRTDTFHLEKDGVQITDLEATLESCNISAGDLLIMRFRSKTRGKTKSADEIAASLCVETFPQPVRAKKFVRAVEG